MKTFLLLLLITGTPFAMCWSQNDFKNIIFTRQFTTLTESAGLEVQRDSLEGYLLTDKTNPYLKNSDLYLNNPSDAREFILIIDQNSQFPQLKFSSYVTNLMNNENEHQVAFYSLDPEFIFTELNADWAIDSQFMIKDAEGIQGYARSFYKSDTEVQITVILLAAELPILRTPKELSAIRFK